MKNQIELIEAEHYGIEKSKANELMGNLPEIIKERSVMEQQYSDIVKMDIDKPETTKAARELRLLIQKNRTQGINVWHKTTKDYFLKGGQFVDAIKRKEVAVNERMESQLEEIEKYAEIQEQKRREELKEKRISELEKYSEFVPFGVDLGILSDEEYLKIFNGAKLQFDAKVEADKKAEEERLENERLDRLEQQRILEVSPYGQFLDKSNPELRLMSDEDYLELIQELKNKKSEYDAEQEKIRLENERLKKEAEAKEKELELERKKAREEAEKLEAKRQAELKAEREKQAKLEAELKAKKEAEIKAEKERLAEIEKQKKEAEKLAKAPIKKQLNSWVDLFQLPNTKIDNELSKEIINKFNGFKKWAKSEIDKL